MPLGPAACQRADFHGCDISKVGNWNAVKRHVREQEWILISEKADFGSLNVRMQRLRGFGHKRTPRHLLKPLQQGFFVKKLIHKEIQVQREPMTQVEGEGGPSGKISSFEQPCVSEYAKGCLSRGAYDFRMPHYVFGIGCHIYG